MDHTGCCGHMPIRLLTRYLSWLIVVVWAQVWVSVSTNSPSTDPSRYQRSHVRPCELLIQSVKGCSIHQESSCWGWHAHWCIDDQWRHGKKTKKNSLHLPLQLCDVHCWAPLLWFGCHHHSKYGHQPASVSVCSPC